MPPAPSINLEGDSVEIQSDVEGTCGADASHEVIGSGGQSSAERALGHALLQGGTVMAESLNKLTASSAQFPGASDVDPVYVDGREVRPHIKSSLTCATTVMVGSADRTLPSVWENCKRVDSSELEQCKRLKDMRRYLMLCTIL